jgi:hypothetical protein
MSEVAFIFKDALQRLAGERLAGEQRHLNTLWITMIKPVIRKLCARASR